MINTIAATNQQILNLNGTEMYGFNSPTLTSNAKIVLNLEFVMYSPYKLLGFQFSPVLFLGMASINKNYIAMLNSRIYQAYAIGLLIRNEYLVSNTFQVSIGLYPYMPGSSNYLIKTNPITNYEVRAKDFFISKPEKVAYQ